VALSVGSPRLDVIQHPARLELGLSSPPEQARKSGHPAHRPRIIVAGRTFSGSPEGSSLWQGAREQEVSCDPLAHRPGPVICAPLSQIKTGGETQKVERRSRNMGGGLSPPGYLWENKNLPQLLHRMGLVAVRSC